MPVAQRPYYAREPRSDLRLPANLFFDGTQRTAELVNVSLSGGFLVVSEPPGLRTVIALSIHPAIGDPLYFNASVMRVDRVGAQVGCAVQFLNLSPESEGRLVYLIKKTARPQPSPQPRG